MQPARAEQRLPFSGRVYRGLLPVPAATLPSSTFGSMLLRNAQISDDYSNCSEGGKQEREDYPWFHAGTL
jgi:hypothetical protein